MSFPQNTLDSSATHNLGVTLYVDMNLFDLLSCFQLNVDCSNAASLESH